MRKSVTIVVLLVVGLVATLTVAACAAPAPTGEVKTEEETTPEEAVTEETPEEAAPVELVLFEHQNEAIDKILDAHLKKFMEANPNITVTRNHYGVEEMRDQFQTAAMVGAGPAIMLAPNDWAGLFAVAGIVKKGEELIDLARFDETAIMLGTYEGVTWGVPFNQGNHLRLYYNKALMEEPPQDTDELIAKAEELTKGDILGFAYRAKEPYFHITFFSAYGGWPLEDATPTLDSEASVKSVQLVQDMIFKYKILNAELDYGEVDSLFKEGKVAMTINGDWAMSDYIAILGDKLGMARLPKVSDGGWPTPMSGSMYLYVNARLKEGPELEATKKLVEFLTSKDVELSVYKDMRQIPTTKEALADPALQEEPVLLENLKLYQYTKPMPNVPEMRAAWDAMFAGLNAAFSGEITAEEAAKLMQQEAEKKIEEMKK